MAKIEMICHCGHRYQAKEADLKRGWALSCDKSCAASRRKHGKPKAKRADGAAVKKTKKKPCSNRPNDNRARVGGYQLHSEDW
jgi:hypothetical protein